MKQPGERKLRTVLLYTSGHLGSAIIFNLLHEMPELEIVALIKAKPLPLSARAIRKHLKKTGWRFAWLLLWQRVIQMLGYGVVLLLPASQERKRIYPGWWLARRLHIPLKRIGTVNSERSEAYIRALAPDLIISAYFNQIIKPNIIAIPRIGILNIHPGWLPAYRGAMSYFWVLKNGEASAGVSIHWIDEGIDTGTLVARKRFRLFPGATQQQVLVKTAVMGHYLIRRIIRALAQGRKPRSLSISEDEAAYYSLPDMAAFDAYFNTRRFFRIRDVLRFMIEGLTLQKPSQKAYVVLLHGILRSDSSMQKIARALRREGYEVINIRYPSRIKPIEELAGFIDAIIRKKCIQSEWKMHIVTHSMGGVIVRDMLGYIRAPENLGRVVMLAPPNNGSEIADALKDNPLYQKLFGPAGQQLGTKRGAITKNLSSEVNFELGVIIGNAVLNPLGTLFIRKENDGTISIESAKLKGMKDFLIIPATHSFITYNKKAIMQTIYFLRHGNFRRITLESRNT